MAGMKEMALGIASALRGGMGPNPLPVELWGYAPEDAAQLLTLIIDECADAGITLHEIRVDATIVHQLTGSKTETGLSHRGTIIAVDGEVQGRMDVYRQPL